MDRVMIDIETLGTEPGCAIVSIGAVRFSVGQGVGETFYKSVSLVDCQSHGMTIDAETLSWWLNQPATAREQLLGGHSLERSLRELRSFVKDCDEIWANSPAFDCAILREGFEALGLDCPWRYFEERDFRTMREVVDAWPDREQKGVEHNAVDDARYQAECLVDALQEVSELAE